jgi:signal transduction histidine kinase/CheY-like chemotaxis protein
MLFLFIISVVIALVVSVSTNQLIEFLMIEMKYNFERRLNMTAERLAELIDIDELDLYQVEADMELSSYQALRLALIDFTEKTDINYAYFLRPMGNEMYFIIDSDFNEQTRAGLDTAPLNMSMEEQTIIQLVLDGNTVSFGLGNYLPGWEGYLTSYAPVFRSDRSVAAIAGVYVEDDGVISVRRMVNILTIVKIIMVILILISGSLSFIRYRQEAHTARQANIAKNNFIASVSHEIRTPMNAITGMAELLLRENLTEKFRDYVIDIRQAGSNLVHIINDILDFSKIESGRLELIQKDYLLASLLNDVVSIIRAGVVEKPIRFFTNIDSNIPNALIGDEMRLRQILVNLLANAVKYTDRGQISLSMTVEKQEDNVIWLKVSVKDTGRGIKPEDLPNVFGDFIQVDMRKNQNIEGTGLGLSIAKRLCEAMDGEIFVESEYGSGCTFTFIIPQAIDSPLPFAAVEEPEKKKVLVYERRIVYAESISWSLTNMKVPHVIVNDHKSLAEALSREEWYFVFSGYGLYEKIKSVKDKVSFPNGKKPPLALMVEWGTEAYIHNVRFVSLPVQSLSIANVLNGKYEGTEDYSILTSQSTVLFTLPKASFLIVDDVATNLKVAEGLLAPYQAMVDTCLSGAEAIELVKKRKYDIVFMDHMMPEMDGIETTKNIRDWETEQEELGIIRFAVPIIALTANAVVGAREFFIENGFDDFLAKPIDISKLNEILVQWVPKNKRSMSLVKENKTKSMENVIVNGASALLPGIKGVDIQHGITMTGGTKEGYRQVLSIYYKDIEKRLPQIQVIPDNMVSFVTHAHSIKSASASIGAMEISALAADLEAAGNAGDKMHIESKLSTFINKLTELVKEIKAWEIAVEESSQKNEKGDEALTVILCELVVALKSQDVVEIDIVLDELSKKPLDAETQKALGLIYDNVLIAEYEGAIKIVGELLSTSS